jgi:hypothetical protein
MKKRLILMGSLVAFWLMAVGVLAMDGFDLGWHVIAGGGGPSSSADYALDGSAGQPAAGTLSGGDYTLGGGFWGGGAAEVTPTTPTATPTSTATPTPTGTPTTPTATPTSTATPTATPTGTVMPPANLIYLPIVLKN